MSLEVESGEHFMTLMCHVSHQTLMFISGIWHKYFILPSDFRVAYCG